MKIRKKDSFQDLPDSVNKLIKSLIDNQKTDLIELQDALNTFESHTENGKEKIREIIRKKQEILKTTKENKTE